MAIGGFDSRGELRPMAEINTTPLVDVMLVLLVIFIITAPLLTHAIRLDLPSAQAPTSAATPTTITLSIDPNGGLFWDNERVSDLDALAARLRVAAQRAPMPEVHLRAHRETRYQRIAEVVSAIQQHGLGKIGLVTRPAGDQR